MEEQQDWNKRIPVGLHIGERRKQTGNIVGRLPVRRWEIWRESTVVCIVLLYCTQHSVLQCAFYYCIVLYILYCL